MHPCRMKNFTLSSLLIGSFLLSACSPDILKGFTRTNSDQIDQAKLYPVFTDSVNERLFNMQIDFRKRHFSGMLIIKQFENNTYRALLTSYFGMKIFDMEFGKDLFNVHYCIDPLNKKQVVNTLKTDLENLFFFNLDNVNNVSVYSSKENDSLKIYKTEKDKHYYLINTKSEQLHRLDVPRFISSLQYRFTDFDENNFPSRITIKHTNIGLKFQLNKLDP